MTKSDLWFLVWVLVSSGGVSIMIGYLLKKRAEASMVSLDDKLMGTVYLIINFLLGVIAAFVMLERMGFDLTMAYAGLGFLSIAAAQLGTVMMKDFLQDAFSGLRMAFAPPFDMLETVTVGKIKGEVRKVTLCKTTLVTGGDERVDIPNSKVLTEFVWRSYNGEL